MTRYFLGMDVGGTKSDALLADEAGNAISFVRGGPGNPHSIGYSEFSQLVVTLGEQAIARAGISKYQIAGMALGIGGYDWSSELPLIMEAVQPLGLDAPVCAVNDATLGILAGTAEGWGIAVVSGSGCNCRGWDRERREGRVTGYGVWMGEGAGASDLMVKALQAVSHEWTRRGPATRLTPALLEHFGTREVEQLLENFLLRRMPWEKVSSAAPIVFRLAAEGDPVARELILWAGRELGELANAVIRQLDLADESFDVVMIGSMFNGGAPLVETMQATIRVLAPQARFVRLTAPPVVGAIVLAMEQAGIAPLALRGRLSESTSELMRVNNQT